MSSDQPLSRREARAIREAELAAARAQTSEFAPLPVVAGLEPTPTPEFGRLPEAAASAVALDVEPVAAESVTAPATQTPQTDAAGGSIAREPAVAAEFGRPGRGRRGNRLIWASIAALALIAIALGTVNLFLGPRMLDVRVDPAGATQASGSRVILTANQVVSGIIPGQVVIEPETPFTVDTAGRDIGIRFTVPLDADTQYTITIDGVESPGASRTSTFQTSFTTPPADLFVLDRQYGSQLDQLRPVTLGTDPAAPVFEHPNIIDFRQLGNRLVVSLQENESTRLIVMDAAGANRRDLALPGEGVIQSLQVADRGNLAGYLFTDAGIGQTSDRGSVLVLESLEGDDQRIVTIGGEEVNVQQWLFIPESRSLLMITFEGELFLFDAGSADAEPQPLGNAMVILGVSRGVPLAYIDRPDGVVTINLETGDEEPFVPVAGETLAQLVALPEGSLQRLIERGPQGEPLAQRVALVSATGLPQTVAQVRMTDQIVQVCASPSGQYAAVVTAPNIVDNPSDFTLLPLPERLTTTVYDIRSDAPAAAATYDGFDPSWCQVAPHL